jgi:hypothetical protein
VPLLSPICATCPAHLVLLYLVTKIIFGEEYKRKAPHYLPCSLILSS